MLDSKQISRIKAYRRATDFTEDFIINFDKEWTEVVEVLKKSKKDLSTIPIVVKKQTKED